jgi:murein DD-endopeptidase MepM/ murein hydrolase activator NlpD
MAAKRYSILVADRRTGVVRRFTLSLRPALVVLTVLAVLPSLVALGALFKARWQAQTWTEQVAQLQQENASMRSATGALTEQVGSLQAALDDFDAFSPTETERAAMARLPRTTQRQALGGGQPDAALLARLNGPSATPDGMGVLRQMLGTLASRLEAAKPQMERQAALARATPAIWPAFGGLSSGFGVRRDPFTATPAVHLGLDISADHGQPVYASADGVVAEAERHSDYGNLVTVSHGFGIESRYAHLSGFAVRPGRTVRRGDIVGYVGSTGRSTSAHLHYEVWIDGRPVNPLGFLVGRDRP